MDAISAAISDEHFWQGVLVASVLWLFLLFYAAYMRAQTLYLTAKNKGREKLGDKFYYIVEESEYNELARSKLPVFGKKEVAAPVGDSDIPFVLYIVKATWKEYFCMLKGQPCYSSDIRAAKFYWSIEEANLDREAFRLLYPLDVRKTIHAIRVDELATDDVALQSIIEGARAQRNFNKENEHEYSER